MLKLNRVSENPLLTPNPENEWEAQASFNPCVIYTDGVYHAVYRALSQPKNYYGTTLSLSTIGHAVSTDGVHFGERKQLIKPENEWEFYGCEDPRITRIDDKFYIFYTALSTYPFSPDGIKVGVAITRDFQKIEEKHLVTPFNAKAMSLFPEKVNGKIAAILTVDTDQPPAKIGLAYFDRPGEIWDQTFWENWYSYISDHTLYLQQANQDHSEIGAPPLKTEKGWLLVYSYIKNYFSNEKQFGIEGLVLQENNPLKILLRTDEPLLTPEEHYELEGLVKNIVFPSGAIIRQDTLSVYYGGADTVCCLANCSKSALLRDMKHEIPLLDSSLKTEVGPVMFSRFEENPIIKPIFAHPWEKNAVMSPTVDDEQGKVHLFYTAISEKGIASIGYAMSDDGFHITDRLSEPVYTPRESFEIHPEGRPHGSSNPKLTQIDDRYYLCYTAFDGQHKTGIGLTSMSLEDFHQGHWIWEPSQLITTTSVATYDACLFPEKIQDKYVFLHSRDEGILLDFQASLVFSGVSLEGNLLLTSRSDKWDSGKIGLSCPPLKTKDGWVLFYHGVDKTGSTNIGCLLMELTNPSNILARVDYPVFTPEKAYELQGNNPHAVLPGGAVIRGDDLLMYYGAGGSVIGVASIKINQLLDEVQRHNL